MSDKIIKINDEIIEKFNYFKNILNVKKDKYILNELNNKRLLAEIEAFKIEENDWVQTEIFDKNNIPRNAIIELNTTDKEIVIKSIPESK